TNLTMARKTPPPISPGRRRSIFYGREKRLGFFARDSHACENEKPGEYAAFCHSRAWLPREESRVLPPVARKSRASVAEWLFGGAPASSARTSHPFLSAHRCWVGSPRGLRPEAPTDPDVRISRIRLFGPRFS